MPLIYPLNSTEKNYNNSIVFLGTSKIKNYNAVKTEFEGFVNQSKKSSLFKEMWNWIFVLIKKKKYNSKHIVKWMPEKSIDATIINL